MYNAKILKNAPIKKKFELITYSKSMKFIVKNLYIICYFFYLSYFLSNRGDLMNTEKRKEILKKLVLSEEDTFKRFEDLIKKSRNLFAIDGKKGKILFENPSFSNHEKVSLFLIGNYFAKELELVDDYKYTSKEISDSLMIKLTTLSGPLGKLVASGYISQEGDKYFINYYKIDEILDSLTLKYQNKIKRATPGLSITTKISSTKKMSSKMAKKAKKSISQSQDISYTEFTMNPKGIDDLAKDLEVDKEKVKSIFDFEENLIHLLRKKHCDKDSDENYYNSVILLTGFYYHFDQREIPYDDLLKYLKEANVSCGSHFKRDMKRKDRRAYIFYKEGNKSYKITDNGIKLGLQLMGELIKR